MPDPRRFRAVCAGARRLRRRERGRRRAAAPAGQAGFTFVELMVVILIIGLAATAVMLAIPDPGGSLRAEAERFAARARAARDAAIVESRPAVLLVGPAGYELSRRSGGRWRSTARYDWAEGTEAEAEAGGAAAARSLFDSTGMAEPLHLVLRRGERRIAIDIGADGNVHVRR